MVMELKQEAQVTAKLTSHGTPEGGKMVHSLMVTPEQLINIPTPEPTRTWRPVPHYDVVQATTKMILDQGWQFVDPEHPYELCLTETYTKLFGVTKILIPGYSDIDKEIALALGFRNSHDKTLSLTFAAGAHVWLCSNLCITADFRVRRSHTVHISVEEVLKRVLDMVPGAAKTLIGWIGNLRSMPIARDTGVSILAEAVQTKALALTDFMPARDAFLTAYEDNNPQIHYGTTYWAVYQAITSQYKKHALGVNQGYSTALNDLFLRKIGTVIG